MADGCMRRVKAIPLTRGYVAIIDPSDWELVKGYNWYPAVHKNGPTYAIAHCRKADYTRTTISMHKAVTGYNETDHENGNGLDNRRSNLRDATGSQNKANVRLVATNKSGFKGVHWYSRTSKWRAMGRINGKMTYFGSFDNPEDAARAYDNAVRPHFGEYARYNFPLAGEQSAREVNE